ncbi:Uncharacterized protein DBV15_00190 [Temnothorax longispinosus]|uniref:Uncharacterized protein n=1 Tax=Temnothorax longispinosus TaxID=300112 RepID=A0A4S2KE54_9HYME|nr:Uncharacterized protein DBV15_00190 [Temnothorax longispinosus]
MLRSQLSRARAIYENWDPFVLEMSEHRKTPQPHVCPCVTVRCRRAEVRDASVGLKSRKRLTLAPVRRGTRWGMQRGDDRLPLPSLFSLPTSTTHATPVENATLNSHASAASHCASPLCTHRPRDHPLHVGVRVE